MEKTHLFLVNLPTKEKVYSYGSTNKAYCRSDKHHDKCPYQRYGNVVVMKNSYSEPCILFYNLRDNNLSL